MTDKEKLQKLFQAALLDGSEEKVTPVRTRPQPTLDKLAAHAPTPSAPPVAAQPAPEPAALAPAPVAVTTAFVQPMENAGLEATAAEELRILLDEQHLRVKRRHRREAIGTLAVFLALIGGGFGWFVHSPKRVQAFRDAMTEIRSVGDITSMAAKYQKALNKIGTRSQDLETATESMGVSSNQDGMTDVYMDAEMKQMMAGEGKTVGERNQVLQKKFDKVKTEGPNATVIPTSPATAPKAATSLPVKP